jgi:hypothetical protein
MELRDHERWWQERGATELRDLLYREWDPIGVKDLAEDSADEYEAYAGQLVRRLRAGASEEEVAALLESFRREMGLEPADPPLEMARRIRDWYAESRGAGGT